MARARRKRTQHAEPKQVAAADLVVELAADPYAEYEGREWSFAWLPDEPPEVVDERALHALVASWRRGRATRSIGDVLSDAYVALFSVLMIGAMIVSVIVGSQTRSAECDTAACLNGRLLVPWAVFFLLCSAALSVARLFGPVLASAAEGFWLLEAPIGRGRVLRGRLWAIIVGAVVVAAALAAALAALAGGSGVGVVAWAAGSGLVAGGLVAWAAWEQSFGRRRPLAVVQGVLTACAAAVMTLMVAVAAGWVHIALPAGLAWAPWVAAAAGAVACVGFGVAAHRRLEHFARGRLTSGGSLVSGLQGAMFGLDLGLARDILVDREAIRRGHVRPTRGLWSGTGALVWRDIQRLLRFPRPLVGVAGAILAPYASDAVGLALLTPFLAAVALMFALIPTLGQLRVLSRTSGLARTLPFTTAQVRTACFVVPALLAAIWAGATLPAFLGATGGLVRPPVEAAAVTVASAFGGLLGAVRWQTAKPVNFAVPMMATGAGAVPPTLIFNLIRGFDVAALVTAPILLNVAPVWSLAIAFVLLLVLRVGFNMEEMQEQAKEQQRQLESERGRPGR